MRSLSICLMILALLANAGGGEAADMQRRGRVRERLDRRIDRAWQQAAEEMSEESTGGEIPLPQGATVRRDVPYGPDPGQRMDVYIPEGARDAGMIFMIHGGA